MGPINSNLKDSRELARIKFGINNVSVTLVKENLQRKIAKFVMDNFIIDAQIKKNGLLSIRGVIVCFHVFSLHQFCRKMGVRQLKILIFCNQAFKTGICLSNMVTLFLFL